MQGVLNCAFTRLDSRYDIPMIQCLLIHIAVGLMHFCLPSCSPPLWQLFFSLFFLIIWPEIFIFRQNTRTWWTKPGRLKKQQLPDDSVSAMRHSYTQVYIWFWFININCFKLWRQGDNYFPFMSFSRIKWIIK